MEFIVDRMVRKILTCNFIDKKQEKTLKYGIYLELELLISLLCIILIGLITKEGIFLTVFICVFSLLRFYTGGLHFDKYIWCLVFSNVLLLFVAYNKNLIFILPKIPSIILEVIIILVLSPQSSTKRNLTIGEKEVFAKRRNIILIIYIIILVTCSNGNLLIAGATEWSLSINAISLILGHVLNFLMKNYRLNRC